MKWQKMRRHTPHIPKLITNWRVMCRLLSLSLVLATLAACSSNDGDQVTQAQLLEPDPNGQIGNVEFHTATLASELFETFRYQNVNRNQFRFAVATFVPAKELQFNANTQHPLQLLGHQLEQGMMTELARRGYIAQDYKATNDIVMDSLSERVFSRDIADLQQQHAFDFYLSGTLAETERGALVNARIIDATTKDVVAAATRFFPNELFWGRGATTLRDGMIYRTKLD